MVLTGQTNYKVTFGNSLHIGGLYSNVPVSASRGPGVAAFVATLATFCLVLVVVYGALRDTIPAALQGLIDALPVPLPGI